MNTIKGLIWDYGGTIDSRGVHWSEVIWDGYQAAGLGSIGKQRFRTAYVEAERQLARTPNIRPHHTFYDLLLIKMRLEMQALGFNPELLEQKALQVARYCDDRARSCALEARPVLQALRRAGYPMVMVSNFYGNLHAVLREYGLEEMFDAVVESAVVGVRKPDPAIFRLGVEALRLPAGQTAAIGDSLRKDIVPAESIGCHTFWLKGTGWDDSENLASEDMAAMFRRPPIVVANLKEVADALL